MTHVLWFRLAASGSFAVALLHVVVIVIGAPAYTYFGAPQLTPLAAGGSPVPALLTSGLVGLFTIWGGYALSAAGDIRPLPLLRAVLLAIGIIYTPRGLAAPVQLLALLRGADFPPRYAMFSGCALAIGVCYLAGLHRGWRSLPRGWARLRGRPGPA